MKYKRPKYYPTTYLLAIFCLSLLFIFCKDTNKKNLKTESHNGSFLEKIKLPFDINKPNKIIKLPEELREISSLTFFKDSQVICNEDESADIYIVDCQTEKIVEHIISNEKGDYEGIEMVGKDLYILKSNGTITEHQNFKQKNAKQFKYKTALSSKNNTEGLGFDPITNSLLIACKNKPYLVNPNEINEYDKCVYQFDLTTKTLIEKPFITIKSGMLREKYGIEQFMPSGIAIHPLTGEFYILSSVGKLLLVIDRNNEIVNLVQLNHKLFKQPEGICFSPDGKTLFISNEGKEKSANILLFNSL